MVSRTSYDWRGYSYNVWWVGNFWQQYEIQPNYEIRQGYKLTNGQAIVTIETGQILFQQPKYYR